MGRTLPKRCEPQRPYSCPVTDQSVPGRPASPSTLRWAVWLLALQAILVAGVTAFFGYEDATATPDNARNAIALTVFFGVLALLLGLVAWLLHRRNRLARGPAVVLELMLLAIGYFMIKAALPWLGVPVMLLGLVSAGLLVTPSAREALGIR